MPDYRIVDGKIRVLHLDLNKSWWKRGMSPYEREVWKVESIIRQVTGLRRITKRHGRYYVELLVREELRARAVAAVRLHFGQQSDFSLLESNE